MKSLIITAFVFCSATAFGQMFNQSTDRLLAPEAKTESIPATDGFKFGPPLKGNELILISNKRDEAPTKGKLTGKPDYAIAAEPQSIKKEEPKR